MEGKKRQFFEYCFLPNVRLHILNLNCNFHTYQVGYVPTLHLKKV